MDLDLDDFAKKDQVTGGIPMDVEKVEADLGYKGKAKIVCEEDASVGNPGNGTSMESTDPVKSSASGSNNSNNQDSCNSDLSFHDDDEDYEDYADNISDYDDDNFFYEEDDYLAMQSQFDNVDLPPGVEATVRWLKDPASCGNSTTGLSNSSDIAESKMKASFLELAESKEATMPYAENQKKEASSSSIRLQTVSTSKGVEEEVENTEVNQVFKQFDTVEDFSDHHYCRMGFKDGTPPKEWAKKIQAEWKILEKDLPDTIFVRVYEARMELLRAVIVGPSGTPYHDGLFVFDCFFPPNYPAAPPMVYYYSGGLRLNPNLYECGKVCLSLLGTWSGKQTELWNPKQSTMLQVLVSIQGLILNAEPYFNEPGYESSFGKPEGKKKSKAYNEDTLILSLKTMIYTLRRPPKYFEDFVTGHFRNRARDILLVCKAYMEGYVVGSVVVKDGVVTTTYSEKDGSSDFKAKVQKLSKILVSNFSNNGSKDLEEFQH